MIHDGDSVSVHRPGFYARRFQTFMKEKVFKKQVSGGPGGAGGGGGAFSGPATSQHSGHQGPSRHVVSNVSFRRSQQFRRTLSSDKGTEDAAPAAASNNPASAGTTLSAPPERGNTGLTFMQFLRRCLGQLCHLVICFLCPRLEKCH